MFCFPPSKDFLPSVIFSFLPYPVLPSLLDHSISMTYYGGTHAKSLKTLHPRSSSYSFVSPLPFLTRLSQVSGLHLTSPVLTLHPSPLSNPDSTPTTPMTRTNCSEQGQQSLCCQISPQLCLILLKLSAAFKIVDLQLEILFALGLCDTMFFGHSLPAFFLFLFGVGRQAPLFLVNLSKLGFFSTQNLLFINFFSLQSPL